MTWAKVDDQFPFHRKSIAVGPLGRDLYVAGLCYAKRERTDGFIPAYVVKHLAPGTRHRNRPEARRRGLLARWTAGSRSMTT